MTGLWRNMVSESATAYSQCDFKDLAERLLHHALHCDRVDGAKSFIFRSGLGNGMSLSNSTRKIKITITIENEEGV